jgi:ribosomal protein L7Ae-like RNA K-turn-binding protein
MMEAKALSLLGLARRAGKLSWQEEANLAAIRSARAKLLIVADDAGLATAKKYSDKCAYYHVPLIRGVTRIALGEALGTAPRSAVAVLDEGFARKLADLSRM